MPREPGEYVARAKIYALNIVLGATPACMEVRAQCREFLTLFDHDTYHIDVERAEAPCTFCEELPHVKGRWARDKELLVLSDYQCFATVSIFGTIVTATGKRRYRRVYIKVPRKNGKSTWFAALGLYMLCADGETGAEVYCGAGSEKQAWEIFGPAREMALKTPELQEYFKLEIHAKNMAIPSDFSKFEPVIGKPGDGASPSCAIVDEYHEHKTAEQYETFDTGQGSRDEPLLLVITTAGDNIGGPCFDLEDEARKVVMGIVDAPDLFGLIYGLDPDDEWDDPESLRKANPNYDISVMGDYLQAKLKVARQRSSHRGIFKTKHLNMWVGARDAYFDSEMWRAAGDQNLNLADYEGRPCHISIDLASKRDPAAMIIIFPPAENDNAWTIFTRFYVPEAKIDDEAFKDYRAWHDAGYMTATPGDIIDFDFIEEDMVEICRDHDVVDVVYDPFQATKFATDMINKHGVDMVEYPMGTRNISEPMKEVDGYIRQRIIRHDGNPVMNWMIGNVVAKVDARDNVVPRKNKDEQKIDGPVALIMGVGRCIGDVEENQPSVYETRGVREI